MRLWDEWMQRKLQAKKPESFILTAEELKGKLPPMTKRLVESYKASHAVISGSKRAGPCR